MEQVIHTRTTHGILTQRTPPNKNFVEFFILLSFQNSNLFQWLFQLI